MYCIGITTQTILAIPVNNQINSNEQFIQTLAALNNCAINQQMKQPQKQREEPFQVSTMLQNVLPLDTPKKVEKGVRYYSISRKCYENV